MPRHPVKTVHVLCPACTDYAIDLQLARAAAGASVDVSCAASRKRCGTFGVAGFRCWDHGISDESERRGFLAAALEKAREDNNYVTHALDVMRRYMLCYCVFAVASGGVAAAQTTEANTMLSAMYCVPGGVETSS